MAKYFGPTVKMREGIKYIEKSLFEQLEIKNKVININDGWEREFMRLIQ